MYQIIITFVSLLLVTTQAYSELHYDNSLTFSSTQKWFTYALKMQEKPTFVVELTDDELDYVSGPLTNDSQEVKKEIQQLLDLQNKRTQKDVQNIVREFGFCGWNMAGYQLGQNKKQDEFIIQLLYDVSKIGFKLKRKFDRVRPSFLDNRLEPAIDIPEHASYPSNHSLESHTLALILSDLYSEKTEQFWKAADVIAYHRELAGVHFPSDSHLGASVARLIHIKLMSEPTYLKFIREHKKSRFVNLAINLTDQANSNCQELIRQNAPK